MSNPALPCPPPVEIPDPAAEAFLDLPAEGPPPPRYAALVEIAGTTYAAGVHTTAGEAETAADVLAGLHLSVTSLGSAEVVPVELVSEVAAAHDDMATGLGRVA